MSHHESDRPSHTSPVSPVLPVHLRYILEGKELEFYQKMLARKKKGQAK